MRPTPLNFAPVNVHHDDTPRWDPNACFACPAGRFNLPDTVDQAGKRFQQTDAFEFIPDPRLGLKTWTRASHATTLETNESSSDPVRVEMRLKTVR